VTNEVQQNRWDQLVRRVAGIIGPGSKVGEVLTELFPVMDVERVPGELLILGGTDVCVGAASIQGDPGEQGAISLFNPADSGKIITISQVYTTSQSGQVIRMELAQGPSGTRVNTERFRDLRRAFVARPVGQIFTEARGAITAPNFQMRTIGSAPLIVKDTNSVAILNENTRMQVGTDTVGTLLHTTFLWRERPAVPAELSI